MNKLDEIELTNLISDFKNDKNQSTFESIYEKYNRLVYNISFSILKNKEDSEDIVQTVFSKIYTMPADKFPSSHYSSWLYSITKNESISLLRKKKNIADMDTIYEVEDSNDEISNIVDIMTFNKMLNHLSSREKEIVSLKLLSSFSFEEISKLIHEPVGTVKWRYYKSLYSLKHVLGNIAMFIISFLIGIKAFLIQNIGDGQYFEEPAKQDNSSSNSENVDKSTNNFFIPHNNTNQEISIGTDITITDYFPIGLLSLSSLFLIIAVTITVLKVKRNSKLKNNKVS